MFAAGRLSGVVPIKPLVVFTPQAYVVPEAAESVVKCDAEYVRTNPMFFKFHYRKVIAVGV